MDSNLVSWSNFLIIFYGCVIIHPFFNLKDGSLHRCRSLEMDKWLHPMVYMDSIINPWASYQIHKNAGCACAGNAGNVFPSPWSSDPVLHHGACVTHMPWCMSGSLTSGFLWNRWRGKHTRLMRNPQLYVSGKRPLTPILGSGWGY